MEKYRAPHQRNRLNRLPSHKQKYKNVVNHLQNKKLAKLEAKTFDNYCLTNLTLKKENFWYA